MAKQLKISSKKADMVLSTLEEKGIIQTIYGAYKKLRGKVYPVKYVHFHLIRFGPRRHRFSRLGTEVVDGARLSAIPLGRFAR
ncbi:hypothetical protein C2W62_53710, partial [Candidatus Entotheonella serta]